MWLHFINSLLSSISICSSLISWSIQIGLHSQMYGKNVPLSEPPPPPPPKKKVLCQNLLGLQAKEMESVAGS